MKKIFLFVAAALLMTSCGMMQSNAGTNAPAGTTTTQAAPTAMNAGQGAGNALLSLYNQYKVDGNKYDYTNMQNMLNTVSLISNCQGLKSNYKDQDYLKDFGKGLVASSLGLVTQSNVQTVTNSLVDMVKNSESVQQISGQAQSTATTAAQYANTASQYAGALSSLLSAFTQK